MAVHYPRTVWKNCYAEHELTGKTYNQKKNIYVHVLLTLITSPSAISNPRDTSKIVGNSISPGHCLRWENASESWVSNAEGKKICTALQNCLRSDER